MKVEVGKQIEDVAMPSRIWLTTNKFLLPAALKNIEGQNNIEELCKTIKEVTDNLMKLSSRKKGARGRLLLVKLLVQCVAPSGNSEGKMYMELWHKLVDMEWQLIRVS